MKIELECEIPDGYEATGEYRRVEDGMILVVKDRVIVTII